MARARNLKPGFFRNAELVELPFHTRLLFAGLWLLADREGRLKDRPKQIKMDLFPADDVDIPAAITELAAAGMLERYSVENQHYIQITNFLKHQNPHRDEKPSLIPPPGGLFDTTGNTTEFTGATGQTPPPAQAAAPEHSANTMQAPCKPETPPVPIGLNPSTLNPSLLNPESNTLNPSDGAPELSTALGVCVHLERLGIAGCNPQSKDLATLLEAGTPRAEWEGAAQTAVNSGFPRFAYLLGVVKNRLGDAGGAWPKPPEPKGRDPELVRIDQHSTSYAPMPAEFRARHALH